VPVGDLLQPTVADRDAEVIAGWQTPCSDHIVMKNSVRLCVPFTFGLFLFVGCSSLSLAPASPSDGTGSVGLTAGQLAGTWSLASIQPAGRDAQAVPDGATYTLTLADGRMSTRADCNTCSSTFTLSGQMLNIAEAMACTRAACPTMAFESAYTSLLAGTSVVAQSGTTLVLTSSRGVLTFTR
jgi:heat shock protein HslJ